MGIPGRWEGVGGDGSVGGGVIYVTTPSHLPDCPNVYLTFACLALKAKSKLIIETHLAMHCSSINYGTVSNKLCQNVILIRLFV